MDDDGEIAGVRDVRDVLKSDPIARAIGAAIERPTIVGAVIFVLVVTMIVFGPATESRFIYTDF